MRYWFGFLLLLSLCACQPGLKPRGMTYWSPNFAARAPLSRVDMLVIHHTAGDDAEKDLAILSDPERKVSAHYMIDKTGKIYRLVPEEFRAWHAGMASWAGNSRVNSFSIGIELVNNGDEAFPEAQMQALEVLARNIIARYAIPAHRVLGHSDVAPQRKQDPSVYFDWARLAKQGIGLWPFDTIRTFAHPTSIEQIQQALACFGYDVPTHGKMDVLTQNVIRAFQRHFRSQKIDGIMDAESYTRLQALLAVMPSCSKEFIDTRGQQVAHPT